jgi:D-alanyl-D-alanine carboxypeptidase (penicillin-binding protein 5/6)
VRQPLVRVPVTLVVATLLVLPAFVIARAAAPQGPPPTPVPPSGSPSPFPQSLDVPSDAQVPPQIDASAALLMDLNTGEVLFAKEPARPRPIASLTKVMTALLTLERRPLDHVVTVPATAVFPKDRFGASSTLGLREGERRTVEELLDALLLGSANDAAIALAVDVSGSVEGFVELMNRRGARLGMDATTFASPDGLDDAGRSTPADLATLTIAALATEGFRPIVGSKVATIGGPDGPRKVQNRNAMLWLYRGAFGVKTGQTAGAGYCLIAAAQRGDRSLVAIVLGDDRPAFDDAAALLNHGFEGFRQATLVARGEDIGSVGIPGGSVRVAAARPLSRLVPVAQEGSIGRRVRVARNAAFPPTTGERVGVLRVSLDGEMIGVVPLIVTEIPGPEPAEGSWLIRAGGAVVDGVGQAVAGLIP